MTGDSPHDPLAVLSEQERRIAELLIAGQNTSEIAKRLSLGYRQVADLALQIRARLGVSSLAELRALRGGL